MMRTASRSCCETLCQWPDREVSVREAYGILEPYSLEGRYVNDVADSGALDQSDVPAPSGASDTGVMMDSRDTGTLDRTDVGELGDGDADESDR